MAGMPLPDRASDEPVPGRQRAEPGRGVVELLLPRILDARDSRYVTTVIVQELGDFILQEVFRQRTPDVDDAIGEGVDLRG